MLDSSRFAPILMKVNNDFLYDKGHNWDEFSESSKGRGGEGGGHLNLKNHIADLRPLYAAFNGRFSKKKCNTIFRK